MSSNENPQGWLPLALSSQVTAQAPLARRCCGREYVLFRDADGSARILEDRCAHRKAPLSLGRITPEGWLECPYHGWRYSGATGDCMQIPNLARNETIPGNYCVENFTAAERDGVVFLWQGANPPGSERPVPDISLPEGERLGEGSCLITLPAHDLATTLLDAPWLVLDLPGLHIVPDHLQGEPLLDERGLAVEWALDWAPLARRRRRTPGDYPLALALILDEPGRAARVEIRDVASYRVVLSAGLYCAPVTHCVSALHWRWAVNPPAVAGQPAYLVNAADRLSLSMRSSVDATQLVALHPYISSVWLGRIPAVEPALTPSRR